MTEKLYGTGECANYPGVTTAQPDQFIVDEVVGFEHAVMEVAKEVAKVAPPEEIRPEVGTKAAIELRGYEIARLELNRWVQVAAYRGSDAGFRQASRDGKYLAERHPETTYRLRPIISVPFPEALPAKEPEPAPEETTSG